MMTTAASKHLNLFSLVPDLVPNILILASLYFKGYSHFKELKCVSNEMSCERLPRNFIESMPNMMLFAAGICINKLVLKGNVSMLVQLCIHIVKIC